MFLFVSELDVNCYKYPILLLVNKSFAVYSPTSIPSGPVSTKNISLALTGKSSLCCRTMTLVIHKLSWKCLRVCIGGSLMNTGFSLAPFPTNHHHSPISFVQIPIDHTEPAVTLMLRCSFRSKGVKFWSFRCHSVKKLCINNFCGA
jgi:hypothetical protein